MSEKKLTPWFPASVKPARNGVYEVEGPEDLGRNYFSYFDGERWHGQWFTPERARAKAPGIGIGLQSDKWRGLAQEPKA